MSTRRPHVALAILMSVVLAVAAAVARAEEPAGTPKAPAPRTGSAYESDPGKYVEEPTKNMEPETPARKPASTTRPSAADAMNAAGLKKVLAKLPEGTRHEFVMMPLTDGVRLATDVFLPPEGDGPWPTILLRTQYSRWDARAFRSMGDTPCVLVLQNVRGSYGSEGAGTFDSHSFDSDINDGHDTFEWIARQKWSNGKVGMWGPSGHGIAPCNAMWSLNPHLTVIDVNVTGDNAYLHWTFSNGARRLLYSAPHGRAYVQISPGGHGAIGGDLKFKARNRIPAEALKASRGLKECLAGEPQEAKSCLAYYLMGDTKDATAPGNVYMVTDHWPVEHTPTSYYMHTGGSLALEASEDKAAKATYVYDPKNPVPSLGGNYDVSDPKRLQIGPLDQRPLKDRKDILRFTSAPLTEPVGITGKVWAELHVSSDAPDTMFTAKLVDIYPDGYEAVIRESAMLARYHQGLNKPAPLQTGKVYKLSMDMWSTALVFNTGHRIAIHVSSSSEPAYEVHPNTYEPVASIVEARAARNTVHLSTDHASRLILPVVPKETYINVGASGAR